MIVEVYDNNGYWYINDANGDEWSTGITSNTPLVEAESCKERLKTVKKLKEAGFTADEIIDFFNGGVFK